LLYDLSTEVLTMRLERKLQSQSRKKTGTRGSWREFRSGPKTVITGNDLGGWIRRAAIWVLGKLEQGRIIFAMFAAAKSRRGVYALLMGINGDIMPREENIGG